MSLGLLAAVLALTTGCFSPVPRSEWPVTDEPLFAHAVWVNQGARYGSGVLIHSSKEHGTYVLTAAHVVATDELFLDRKHSILVGAYDLSHVDDLGEDHALYKAEIVAATLGDEPTKAVAEFLGKLDSMVSVLTTNDIAVLRLKTDRLFRAATLYVGDPNGLSNAPAVAIPVVPKMYPHRKAATCSSDDANCPTGEPGNSGCPIYVKGEVVGLHTSSLGPTSGPGPAKLQAFMRENEALRFLVEGTPAEHASEDSEAGE